MGDKDGNVGRDRGSQRIMDGLEGHSVKSRFHSKCNGKDTGRF